MATIKAPATGFTGRVAGIQFVAGTATVDELAGSTLAYFRRHGYTIGTDVSDDNADGPPAKSAKKADWLAYAETLATDSDTVVSLEAMSKEELQEFVEAAGDDTAASADNGGDG